ncbi:hypothetical protein ACNKHS_25015 [Shigella flexneri]
MHSYLAVGTGSRDEFLMSVNGTKAIRLKMRVPSCWSVGVTFDSGGISIKPFRRHG